jgi:hypothetical protein
MRAWICVVFVALLVAACSRSVSVDLAATPLTVVQYSQGKAQQRCSIAPGSAKFAQLADFLKQNEAGWHKRSSDYTPALVVIGSDLNLYFAADLLVMNYHDGEYSRQVAPESYAFLSCGTK